MAGTVALDAILTHLRAEPSRNWSLIITIFGDMVVPRGGSIWLGTLLAIFDALGIGGNAVRTASSRLVADGWLERSRSGRNSYYQLASKGHATFGKAADRIYGQYRRTWDGIFSLVVLSGEDRDAARTTLEQSGYAQLSSGFLLATHKPAVIPKSAIHLSAETDPASARRLAYETWPTQLLAKRYERFLNALTPLRAHVDAGQTLSDLDALVGRLLLVHEYRRIVLRDPMLPYALLPEDWPGHAARSLCASLYPRLLAGSERWLDQHGATEDGPLPPPSSSLRTRFQV